MYFYEISHTNVNYCRLLGFNSSLHYTGLSLMTHPVEHISGEEL